MHQAFCLISTARFQANSLDRPPSFHQACFSLPLHPLPPRCHFRRFQPVRLGSLPPRQQHNALQRQLAQVVLRANARQHHCQSCEPTVGANARCNALCHDPHCAPYALHRGLARRCYVGCNADSTAPTTSAHHSRARCSAAPRTGTCRTCTCTQHMLSLLDIACPDDASTRLQDSRPARPKAVLRPLWTLGNRRLGAAKHCQNCKPWRRPACTPSAASSDAGHLRARPSPCKRWHGIRNTLSHGPRSVA